VRQRLPGIPGARVRHEGDAADLEARPARRDALQDRRHADGVAAEPGEHPHLGRRLVGRSGEADVHAFGDVDLLGRGRFEELPAQPRRPGFGHVREAEPDRIGVRADERVAAGEVDVVADEHQRPRAEARVEAAGGVGQQDRTRAQAFEEEYRLDDEAGVVALVEVEPPLEHDDGPLLQRTQQQPAGMAGGGRGRPARHVREGNRLDVPELVGQAAQARAEHDPELRHEVRPLADRALESVEERRLIDGADGPARVEPRRGIGHRAEVCLSGRGRADFCRPTGVPTPGCRSRPAERPGDGIGMPSRPGTEAPEATGLVAGSP